MIGMLAIGWRYMPDGMRENVLGFAELANFGAIVHALRDAAAPEDPVARRALEIEALKQKVGAIHERVAVAQSTGNSGVTPALLEEIGMVADEAVSIISQLEEANRDQSLGGRVAARVIDAVLPAPYSAQCMDVK